MVYSIYWMGKQIINEKVGIVAAIFLFMGTFTITNTFVLWTHFPSSFFVTIAIASYIKFNYSNNKNWLIISGFCTSAAMMMRFVNIWLSFPLVAFLIYDYLQKNDKKSMWFFISYLSTSSIFYIYLYKLYDYNRYFWGESYSMNFITGIDTAFEIQVITFFCINIAAIMIPFFAYYLKKSLKGHRINAVNKVSAFSQVIIKLKRVQEDVGYIFLSLFIFSVILIAFILTQTDLLPGIDYLLFINNPESSRFSLFIHYSDINSLIMALTDNLINWDELYKGNLITSSLIESSPFFALAIFGGYTLFKKNLKFFTILTAFILSVISFIMATMPAQTWAYNVRFFQSFVPLLCIFASIPVVSITCTARSFIKSRDDYLVSLIGILISVIISIYILLRNDLGYNIIHELFLPYQQVWSRANINIFNGKLALMLFLSYGILKIVQWSSDRLDNKSLGNLNKIFIGIFIGFTVLSLFGGFIINVYMNTANPVIAYKYNEDPGYCIIGSDLFRISYFVRGEKVIPVLEGVEGFIKLIFGVKIDDNLYINGQLVDILPGFYIKRMYPSIVILFVLNVIITGQYLIKKLAASQYLSLKSPK